MIFQWWHLGHYGYVCYTIGKSGQNLICYLCGSVNNENTLNLIETPNGLKEKGKNNSKEKGFSGGIKNSLKVSDHVFIHF